MEYLFLATPVFAAFVFWCYHLWQHVESVNAEIENAITENRRLWLDAPYSKP